MPDRKLTVLSFIDWYRPGYKAGGTITAFGNFVDHLEEQLDFKIVTRDCDYIETKPYPNIASNSWLPFSKTLVFYLSKQKTKLKTIKRIVDTTKFDWLYVNGIFSLYFSILPLVFAQNKNCIVNPHGMLSDQAFSVKNFKKRIFIYLGNLIGLYKNAVFHVANEKEAQDVKIRIKRFKDIRIINQLPRKLKFDSKISEPKSLSEVLKFVTVARISSEKGIYEILQALATTDTVVILDIYGAIYDAVYWRNCEEFIKTLPPNITVNYKGSINGDLIIDTLRIYDFFILLSKGENFGHAILEAFSAGCPVLISDKTPWKDLESKFIGWDIDINNQQEIRRAIADAVKMSPSDYAIWSRNAIEFAKDFSDNPGLIEQNKALFSNA